MLDHNEMSETINEGMTLLNNLLKKFESNEKISIVE